MAVVFLKRSIIPLASLLLCFSGCGSIFLYPSSTVFVHPSQVGLQAESVFFPARDRTLLHAWWLPAAGSEKGVVLFLHGNAENITSHVRSVYWLPNEGWSVFLLDYRGYGFSHGSPTVRSIIDDSQDAMEFLSVRRKKFVLFGQSLGAAVAVNAGAEEPYRSRLQAVVLDGGFSSFPQIVRDKLALFWITWPFQYPLTIFMSRRYDPVDKIGAFEGISLLLLHGGSDPVVPSYHSSILFEAAREPKESVQLPSVGHIGMLENPEVRRRFLEFLESSRCAAVQPDCM